MLVTSFSCIADTCSIMTLMSFLSIFSILFFISLYIWDPLTCFLFFFPSVIVGISTTSKIFPSSKKQIDPVIPGSIPIISMSYYLGLRLKKYFGHHHHHQVFQKIQQVFLVVHL